MAGSCRWMISESVNWHKGQDENFQHQIGLIHSSFPKCILTRKYTGSFPALASHGNKSRRMLDASALSKHLPSWLHREPKQQYYQAEHAKHYSDPTYDIMPLFLALGKHYSGERVTHEFHLKTVQHIQHFKAIQHLGIPTHINKCCRQDWKQILRDF